MIDKPDFKSVEIEKYCIDSVDVADGQSGLFALTDDEVKTIQTALRLADRLQSGEVIEKSKALAQELENSFSEADFEINYTGIAYKHAELCNALYDFEKAMAAQGDE